MDGNVKIIQIGYMGIWGSAKLQNTKLKCYFLCVCVAVVFLYSRAFIHGSAFSRMNRAYNLLDAIHVFYSCVRFLSLSPLFAIALTLSFRSISRYLPVFTHGRVIFASQHLAIL